MRGLGPKVEGLEGLGFKIYDIRSRTGALNFKRKLQDLPLPASKHVFTHLPKAGLSSAIMITHANFPCSS